MEELNFSNNFSDNSVKSGENAGFQFDFSCQRCSDTWRSPFIPFQGGQMSSWVHRASGLAGGLFGKVSGAINQAGNLADGLAQAGYGKEHDAALAVSIEKAKAHFNRCARCHSHVCARCWNTAKGLCFNCSPDVHAEVEAARATGEVAAAVEAAQKAGAALGAAQDVTTPVQLVCPKCNAEAHGGKFCPQCGAPLNVVHTCSSCKQTVPSGAKFCPNCGAKG